MLTSPITLVYQYLDVSANMLSQCFTTGPAHYHQDQAREFVMAQNLEQKTQLAQLLVALLPVFLMPFLFEMCHSSSRLIWPPGLFSKVCWSVLPETGSRAQLLFVAPGSAVAEEAFELAG